MKPLEETIDALDTTALANLSGHLLGLVNPERVARIDRTLAQRTRFLTVVLENIYRAHNASAVVRSCECFGVQDLHVIESSNALEINRSIVQGADKWITLHRYRGRDVTTSCLRRLKQSGYRIVAMSPEPGGVPVEELPVEAPAALCLGSEEPGLSDRALSMADAFVTIPMQGFTRSLNLSVSTAIALQQLTARVRRSRSDWGLEPLERDRLRTLWLAQSIARGREIVHRHLAGN